MPESAIPESLRKLEIPGNVSVRPGRGNLPRLDITSPMSRAEIYLLGAHVTSFQKSGEPPLLFTSASSRYQSGHAIRGGVPIIFPWFGPRQGQAMHGVARIASWIPLQATAHADGRVGVEFILPDDAGTSLSPFTVRYAVVIGETLDLELTVTNTAREEACLFENCLHTYLATSDIGQVTLRGLQRTDYLDKVDGFSRKTETREAMAITGETDRVFLDAPQPLEMWDMGWHRIIRIEKTGSQSTVVWNPWRERSQQMADLGNEDYRRMLCVESGNVASNRLNLPPGARSVLSVRLATHPMT